MAERPDPIDPIDAIAAKLDEEGYGYWINARDAASDAIAALAAAGLRVVPKVDDDTRREGNPDPVFESLPSGVNIARWLNERYNASTFQNPGGGAITLCDDPHCSLWMLATVDHDEQEFYLLDIRTGDTNDHLFVTAGLIEGLSCEWRQEPSTEQRWNAETLAWFYGRIDFFYENQPATHVLGETDG